MDTRQRGIFAENLAASYFRAQGYAVIAQNYRCPLGEIDFIVTRSETLYFVEVKARWSHRKGKALDQITRQKQRKITRVATYYLQEFPRYQDRLTRLSVLAVDYRNDTPQFDWIPDAFDAVGWT